MAYRLDGDDPVRSCLLPFVVTPYRLVVSSGKVCGLKVRPGEVLVAVPAVAVSRDLPVRGPDASDAAAVGGVVTHSGEAIDMAHFEHDRKAEDLSDAGHGEELRKLLFHLELLGNQSFRSRRSLPENAE